MTRYKNTGTLNRNVRVSTGMTQKQFADMLGIHSQYVSNIERKTCAVPRKVAKKLLKKSLMKRDEYLYNMFLDYRNHLEEKF